MKVSSALFAFSLVAGAALAVDPASVRPPPPREPTRSPFVFELLPKSLQTHPSLQFHVITELTPEGRARPEPTPARPVYYIAQAGKFTQLGNNTPGNEQGPDVAYLTRSMQQSLAESSYRLATPGGPLPSLAIVFNYGSFARFSTDADDLQQMMMMEQLTQNEDGGPSGPFMPSGDNRDVDSLLPLVLAHPHDRTDVLQRAEIVGGQEFARRLAAALDQEAIYRQSQSALMPSMDAASPFHRFMDATPEIAELVDESFSSCYFVIASAYDYVAMRKGQKVLLWRTKMSVNSIGVSMSESLPSLVLSAGPYFGREMTDAVSLQRKISRNGKVEVGTPEVIDYSTPGETNAPSPNRSAKPARTK